MKSVPVLFLLAVIFASVSVSTSAGDISQCENYIIKKVEGIYSYLDKEDRPLNRSQGTVARLAMGTILDANNDYICKEQEKMLDDVIKVFDIKIKK